VPLGVRAGLAWMGMVQLRPLLASSSTPIADAVGQAKGSATRGQKGARRFVYGMFAKSGGMAPGVET
jgi:hypothetical protein